jgi:arylsulfatase
MKTTRKRNLMALSLALGATLIPACGAEQTSSAPELKRRSHLPMPNTVRQSLVTYDAKSPDTKFPAIEQLRPPKSAPNVLIHNVR